MRRHGGGIPKVAPAGVGHNQINGCVWMVVLAVAATILRHVRLDDGKGVGRGRAAVLLHESFGVDRRLPLPTMRGDTSTPVTSSVVRGCGGGWLLLLLLLLVVPADAPPPGPKRATAPPSRTPRPECAVADSGSVLCIIRLVGACSARIRCASCS